MTGTRRLRLADLSVPMFWRMQQHQDEMLREFSLLTIGQQRPSAPAVPARLLALVEGLRARYAGERGLLFETMRAAAERREETATVEVDVPTEAADHVAATLAAYEEADAYCRAGDHLLTLATPDDVAAYRRWVAEEIVRQLSSA